MPDDNQGQVQRLPTGNESAREGGVGVYFHFEYFGSPRSYKWSNSNNLVGVDVIREVRRSANDCSPKCSKSFYKLIGAMPIAFG